MANLSDYINKLVAKGHYTFSSQEATQVLGVSEIALRSSIRRLKQKGRICSPLRQFHVIVPPQYLSIGCLPPEYFIDAMMTYLGQPYYVSLLSAAQFHGAAHQLPQRLSVMLKTAKKEIQCSKVGIDFSVRKSLSIMPISKMQTNFGYFNVATPETTAIDLITYPQKSAGLNNIATVLMELADKIDPDKLKNLVKESSTAAILQRLGYLLEFVEQENLANVILDALKSVRCRPVKLDLGSSSKEHAFNRKWNVIVNTDIEVDDI